MSARTLHPVNDRGDHRATSQHVQLTPRPIKVARTDRRERFPTPRVDQCLPSRVHPSLPGTQPRHEHVRTDHAHRLTVPIHGQLELRLVERALRLVRAAGARDRLEPQPVKPVEHQPGDVPLGTHSPDLRRGRATAARVEPNTPIARDEIANKETDKGFHEWGQSVDGFERLVKTFSQPGDVVCDPFLGGGTTAIAALAQARRFVGCDVDERAIETSAGRLAA